MKPIRCYLGLHHGSIRTRKELDQEISGRIAFKCSLCGTVMV